MINSSQIEFIVVIANREKEELINEMLIRNSVKLINTVFGRGVSRREIIKQSFGFGDVQDKVIMIGVIRQELSLKVLSKLETDFKFNEVNHGLAFTIPIESIKY